MGGAASVYVYMRKWNITLHLKSSLSVSSVVKKIWKFFIDTTFPSLICWARLAKICVLKIATSISRGGGIFLGCSPRGETVLPRAGENITKFFKSNWEAKNFAVNWVVILKFWNSAKVKFHFSVKSLKNYEERNYHFKLLRTYNHVIIFFFLLEVGRKQKWFDIRRVKWQGVADHNGSRVVRYVNRGNNAPISIFWDWFNQRQSLRVIVFGLTI